MNPDPTPLVRPPGPRDATSVVTRLVPEPPARDTDLPVPAAVQGTLALDLGRSTVPAPRAGHLRAVPDPGPAEDEVRAWAARFAQAVVEVTGGDRPLTQLLRWTSPRVYAELGRRVQVMARSRPVDQRRRTLRPQVRSVHVFLPVPTGAEVSVHVRHGRRSRAIAARLELDAGRWTCTALRIG